MQLVDEKDTILRTRAAEIDFNDPPFNLSETITAMFETMTQQNGIGLAGPQVGLPYRIFVMGNKHRKWVVINPSITTYGTETEQDDEGCLSFPGLALKIKRSKQITVSYQNETGTIIQEQLEDIWARCFQHETDHVDGICFDARVGKLSLAMAKKRKLKNEARSR